MSLAGPPANRSSPFPPFNVSLPSPPARLSAPASPTSVLTAPSPTKSSLNGDPVRFSTAVRVSDPSPMAWPAGREANTSAVAFSKETSALPVPPLRLSSSGPPCIRSLPPPPEMSSLPSSPQMRSPPPAPLIVSFPPSPMITSAPAVPVRLSSPSVPKMVAGFPKHIGSAPAALGRNSSINRAAPLAARHVRNRDRPWKETARSPTTSLDPMTPPPSQDPTCQPRGNPFRPTTEGQ